MIVDDDPAIRKTVEIILHLGGYQVAKAASGQDCLALLREGFRGVILMDIMMPELNGWQTIRSMAQDGLHQGCLICMLTARTHPGDEAEGLEEMVFDYLAKPFDAAALLALVGNAAGFLPA